MSRCLHAALPLRRSARLAVVAATVGTCLLAGSVATPRSAVAATEERAGGAGAVLALVDQTDWVRAGAPFDLRVAVRGEVGADATLVLDIHGPVTSRSQFTATLDGDLLGVRRAEVVVPLAEMPEEADGSRRVRLTQVPTSAAGERATTSLARAGVYPVVVSVRTADPAAEAPAPFTTYLVRTPEETVPLKVAILQPFAAPLAHRPDGSVTFPPGAVDDLSALAQVLAGSAPMPLTIAPRPETVEALATVAAQDRSAAAALRALVAATGGRQVLSSPYVEIAPEALEAAGLGDDVAAQRRRGDDAVEATLGVRTDPRTWVLDSGAEPASIRRLAALGVDQIVLPDAALSPVTLRLTLTRPFSVMAGGDGFDLQASSPEPALSQRYRSSAGVLAAQHLLADLAVLHGDEPGRPRARGVVVAPPPGVEVDLAFLSTIFAGIGSAPILEAVTLDAYFADVDQEGADDPLVRSIAAGRARLGIGAAEVDGARSRLTGYASMVVDDDARVRELHDLTLLAEAEGLGVPERRAYLAGVGRGIDARLGQVGVVDGAAFRLPDSDGTIPLTLVREGSGRLRVRVTLESERLEFGSGKDRTVGRRSYDMELTSENTPLVVPVRVRSPGSFPLSVTITSPDGRLDVVRAQVTIRSTAYSGVGVALSAGAVSFLLLWWARHWRTVRRARRLVPVT